MRGSREAGDRGTFLGRLAALVALAALPFWFGFLCLPVLPSMPSTGGGTPQPLDGGGETSIGVGDDGFVSVLAAPCAMRRNS